MSDRRWADEAESLRETAKNAMQTISDIADQLDAWAQQSREGGWSTHQVQPMREKADALRREAAFIRRQLTRSMSETSKTFQSSVLPDVLPCPFCGAVFDPEADDPAIVFNYSPNDVTCMKCIDECYGVSVKRWNNRTSKWQPIETAPRDGAQILLFWSHYRYGGFDDPEPLIAIGKYKLNHRIRDAEPERRIGLLDSYFADTDESDDYGCAQPEHQPTHWMPLPDPPK